MKKTIFLSLITIVIFSCQQQTAHEKGQLEGVWERIATVNYENFKPVDTIPMEEKFSQIKRKKTKNIVMVSRILKNKGVIEFFKASQLLKLKYPYWKFKMIGSSDYNSPDKISRETI